MVSVCCLFLSIWLSVCFCSFIRSFIRTILSELNESKRVKTLIYSTSVIKRRYRSTFRAVCYSMHSSVMCYGDGRLPTTARSARRRLTAAECRQWRRQMRFMLTGRCSQSVSPAGWLARAYSRTAFLGISDRRDRQTSKHTDRQQHESRVVDERPRTCWRPASGEMCCTGDYLCIRVANPRQREREREREREVYSPH